MFAIVLALAACGRQPRSLLVVELEGAGLPALQRLVVRAAGTERTVDADVPIKIGLYLPSTVSGRVAVTVDGFGADGRLAAHGTGEAIVAPGEIRAVPIALLRVEPAADGSAPGQPDGGAARDGRPLESPPSDGGQPAGDGSPPTLGPVKDAATITDAELPAPGAFGCPRDPSLRACYTFEEGPVPRVADGSGNGNDGTTGVRRVQGISGMALHFETGRDLAVIPDSPTLRLTGEATLEAWVRPSALPGDGVVDFVVAKWSQDANGYLLGMVRGLVAGYSGGNTGFTGGKLAIGTWSHIAVVFGRAALTLYQDGMPVGTFAPLVISASAEPLGIGNRATTGAFTPDPTTAFYGDVDTVRIYARAKSHSEICASANRLWMGPASCRTPSVPPP
jgi:hypothetical protein